MSWEQEVLGRSAPRQKQQDQRENKGNWKNCWFSCEKLPFTCLQMKRKFGSSKNALFFGGFHLGDSGRDRWDFYSQVSQERCLTVSSSGDLAAEMRRKGAKHLLVRLHGCADQTHMQMHLHWEQNESCTENRTLMSLSIGLKWVGLGGLNPQTGTACSNREEACSRTPEDWWMWESCPEPAQGQLTADMSGGVSGMVAALAP